MSDLAFPTLISPNWKMTRTPQWMTKVQLASSGARTSAGLRSTPLWKWTLKNGVLLAAETVADLEAIEGFVNTLAGMYDSFLWTDPDASGPGTVRVAFLSDAIQFERLSHQIWQTSLSFEQVTN
jgi:phage-related protein